MKDYNGEVRCGDCRNLQNSCCEPAGEFLRQNGWPPFTIRPKPTADASRCPDFEPSNDYLAMMEEALSYREEVDRVALLKGHGPG